MEASQSLYDNFFDDDKDKIESEDVVQDKKEMEKEDYIKEACDALMSNDEFFESQATALKSVDQIKAQYRSSLEEAFENTDFEEKMNLGVEIIQQKLSSILSPADCTIVYQELANFANNPANFSTKQDENSDNSLEEEDESKEKSDISHETFQSIYTLGLQLIQQAHFEEAEAIFTVLLFLNQKMIDFWIGAGMALCSNLKYEEAQEYFNYAKLLDPDHVTAFYHSALNNQKLGNEEEVKSDYAEIERIFSESEEEKIQWEAQVSQLNNPS